MPVNDWLAERPQSCLVRPRGCGGIPGIAEGILVG